MEWSARGVAVAALLLLLSVGCGRGAFLDPAAEGNPTPSNPGVTPSPTVPPATGFTRQIDVVDTGVVIGGPHIDFPVAVHLTGAYLVAQTGIYFSTDIDGTIPMDFEVEQYDDINGELLAWVRIPSLTAQTSFFIQYGNATDIPENPTGLWSADYFGVWHMASDPSDVGDIMTDSSPELLHGNPNGNMQTEDLITGKVGFAIEFDGSDIDNDGDWVDLGNPPALVLNNEITIMAWARPNSTGDYMGIAGKLRANGDNGYAINKHSSDRFRWQSSGAGTSVMLDSDNTYTDTNWHHIVGVNRAGTHFLYVDGIEQTATNTKNRDDNGSFAHIGRQYSNANTRTWNGAIDEVRISNTPRTADWIATVFSNTNDPDGFFSVSSEL